MSKSKSKKQEAVNKESNEEKDLVTVFLKEDKEIQIPLEDLDKYLEENRDNLAPRKFKRRGPRRSGS